MNFSTYRFTLDLQKHQSQMSIAAFHYDTAIKLSIGLTDGGVPYYLEDGCIAVLWGTRADGSPISHKCSIENNTRIIYEFNNETAKITGVVNCQIRLYKDGEEIITAPKFIIVVAERLVNDIDILDAEDDVFTHEQLSALDGLFVNESARAEAEAGRVEAENVRDGNERLRDEKEQTRIDFENERQIEEAKRVIAETNRELAEEERKKNYSTLKDYVDKGKEEALSVANAVSKKQSEIENRVSDLESLTLTYIEETSTDYEKVAPAEVGKYALIKSIGGATEKVTSKNVCNPREFKDFFNCELKSINPDGSVDITTFANDDGYSCFRYYVDTEKHYYAYSTFGTDGGVTGYPEGYIDYILTPEAPGTFKCKIMLFETDMSNEEGDIIFSAPENTVFEPYFEPYFQNSEVERIESLGSNLLPFPYYDGTKTIGEGYTMVQRGITYTVLSDGGIKVKGTSESTQMFILAREFNFEAGKTYFKRPTSQFHVSYKDETGTTRWMGNSFVWKDEYKLVQIYIQIEKGSTVDEVIYPYINVGAVGEYKPYQAEPIDTITIPEAVRSKDGYGREGSYIKCEDDVWTLTVTKDENLEYLAEPITTDITHLFNEDNAIEVQGGGVIRFVNELEIAVPSTIGYVTRKG